MEKKLLIIDDNVQDQKVFKRYMLQVGFQNVLFADNGEKGVEMVKAEKPDMVILDTELPGIDGFETCRRIKEIGGGQTRVIVLTGQIDAVDAGKARQNGADDYCVKTADCLPLLEAVRKILAS
jgi:two-component system response regulator MtrA